MTADDCAHEASSPRRTVVRAVVFGSIVVAVWCLWSNAASADESHATIAAAGTEQSGVDTAVDSAVDSAALADVHAAITDATAAADRTAAVPESVPMPPGPATEAVGTIAPEVAALVEPVVASVDRLAAPAAPMAQPAVAVAERVLTPLTAPVHQVAGSTVQNLVAPLTLLVQPVASTVVGPLAPLVEPVAHTVDAVVAPVTASVDEVVEPVAARALGALTAPAGAVPSLPAAPTNLTAGGPANHLAERSAPRPGLRSLSVLERIPSAGAPMAAGDREVSPPSEPKPAWPKPLGASGAAGTPWTSSAGSSSRTGNQDSPDRFSRAVASAAAVTRGVTPASSAPLGARVVGASVNSGSRPAVTPD